MSKAFGDELRTILKYSVDPYAVKLLYYWKADLLDAVGKGKDSVTLVADTGRVDVEQCEYLLEHWNLNFSKVDRDGYVAFYVSI